MSTRKDFIAASSLFALAPAVGGAATPSPSPSSKAPSLRLNFDKARFDKMLARPAVHKQCFGATKIEGGGVIDGMNNTIDAYVEYFGETPAGVHTAAVLYHGAAIALAMNDGVWNEILLPFVKGAPPKLRDEFAGAKPGKGNPYLKDVRDAVARGSSFFVCHNAIVGFSHMAAGALGKRAENVHTAIMAGIVPGALAVPAGVMAINACQEAKFTYIQASL
ncbi:MAG TPA: hypothetical protein VFN37_04095 [Candidatus Baltobacteraceae bacterium]|nr:hypothetical protein [Candidatus Baltobacteraceae bacterium]